MKRITKEGEFGISATSSPTLNNNLYHSHHHHEPTTPTHRNVVYGLVGIGNASPIDYPHRLNTFIKPPDYEISIEQFEEFAFARLQVLRALDSASMRLQRDEDILRAIKVIEEKYLPLHSNESAAAYDLSSERRKDHASHFILRLAYCNDADSIRWFVTQETLLFRLRWSQEMSRERIEFIRNHTADLPLLDTKEKKLLLPELVAHSPGREQDEFFKVPFQLVPDLVGRRAVYLHQGLAHVPRTESFSILITRFRENLEFWMEKTAKVLPTLTDERLIPLLQLTKTTELAGVNAMTPIARGFVEGGKLTATELDAASVHFPPCMQRLYQHGKQDHHLKYGGRQQLGLFFKGIGLPLEEAIQSWRRLFVPKCGEDGFTKNYLYNIRHNYGQEGKRANYGPTPCSKIINGAAPAAGDYHGCPFKHCSTDALTTLLSTYSSPITGTCLNSQQIEDLVQTTKTGSGCQAACTKLFEYTRKPDQPVGQIETFAYPTNFFEASVKMMSKLSKGRSKT